jgi:hypothetical protein
MPKRVLTAACVWALMLTAPPRQAGAQQPSASPVSVSPQAAFVNEYCITCHNSKLKVGGLALDQLDLSNIGTGAETWEKVVRKLSAGMMPPMAAPHRPDKVTADGFRTWLESELDRAEADHPNAGRTETFHRLNRSEYHNAVRDLLAVDLNAVDLDVMAMLPGDDASYGFDNIAGVLRFSPALMDRYMSAAKKISRAAIGTPVGSPNFEVFRIADDLPQDDRLEGMPFGTRGGTLLRYNFPVDGEYSIRIRMTRQLNSQDLDMPRFPDPQVVEISVDGEQLKVFELAPAPAQSVNPEVNLAGNVEEPKKPSDGEGKINRGTLDADWVVRAPIKAGSRDVRVAFLNSTLALRGMWRKPFPRPFPPGTHQVGSRKGMALMRVEISGPFKQVGPGDTASRQRIFSCHPKNAADEAPCAMSILTTLARRAYRRPVTQKDVAPLMAFFEQGRDGGGFEPGIELAIEYLLVSPEFLFRTEGDPNSVSGQNPVAQRGGASRNLSLVAQVSRPAPQSPAAFEHSANGQNYRISDVELASRLSFFLWSSIPDDELIDLAGKNQLHEPAVLERQVRRMLADPRSKALVENFIGQWLYLRNVPFLGSEPYKDPDCDDRLRDAMKRETEMFTGYIIQQNRPITELLTAKYTFLNERLAKHYGIPAVYGEEFRKVELPEGSVRGGLLGQASILAATSNPNRTSPVKRGKWILENILGTPPPNPPANVPALDEKQGGAVAVTMRERMAQHRANPVCSSCHTMMDPMGLALENFDQAGRWRAVDDGLDSRRSDFTKIDTSGVFLDGTKFDGPAELRQLLMRQPEQFVGTVTGKLLTYALGRGLEYYDQPTVRAIVRESRPADFRFASVVMGIVNSMPFQMRRSES